MSEEIIPPPREEPTAAQWSIKPQEHEHAPLERPPFDILYIPETPRVIELGNIFVNLEGRARKTDNKGFEARIQDSLERQKQRVEEFNANLEQNLRREGKTQEEINERKRKFFDGQLARLHPHDFGINGDTNLFLRLGETTYFTYAGGRRREDLDNFGYDRLGLPLAVCSVLTAPSEDGTNKLLYTVRGIANEAYPGWYHAVGGTVQTIHNGIANPILALRHEIKEELGLRMDEFEVAGVTGIIMNNSDIHPELVCSTSVKIPVEEWHEKRETDKEVDAKFFTDTPENLEAFILGKEFGEVPDARPIVPSGLAGYLFHGRIKYGKDWYNRVRNKLPQY